MKIEGVNVEAGLSRLGGRLKSYQKILSVFAKESRQKLLELQECFGNTNAALYKIHVHGLKSALANIGAQPLSTRAESLELAEDWDFVISNHPSFANDLSILLDNVDVALQYGTGDTKATTIDIAKLKQALQDFRKSLDEIDFDEMDTQGDILAQYETNPAVGEKIKAIMHKKLTGDFDAAITAVDELISELK